MCASKSKTALNLIVLACLMSGIADTAIANPTGMSVASGSATAHSNGSQLTVTTGNSAVLNWQSFNIAANETTTFIQPSVYSVVVNNIHDANASQIYGSLQANGMVVLMNSSGFYFGPDSFVKTGGLIVSTANCIPPENSGGSWEFNGPPPLASIVNFGKINIANGGSAFLIADEVENYGDITAPGGTIGIAAGQQVFLSERPDGRGLSMKVNLPEGSVDNDGHLVADGGMISVNAQVVNQNGIIQADSVQNQNGVIELVASDQLNLGANSQILANGDASAGGSSGGTVTLQSANTFSDDIGSQISVAGGSQGGNGGNVEVSAPNILSLNSSINAGAQDGWSGGAFTLDPENITLGSSGTTSGGTSGTINGTGSSGSLSVNVNTAFQHITAGQILLEASGNITLNAGTTWNLSTSTGVSSGQLTLEAGGNITFGNSSEIFDANNWSLTLDAGYSFTKNAVQTGVGNIYLNGGSGQTGSGSIQTASGSISLNAGNGIQIGSGAAGSSAGNITWQAGGDIQFGDGSQITDGNNGLVTLDAGYSFTKNAVQTAVGNIYLNGGLSGDGVGGSIQAADGGINLAAGQNITVGSGYVITTAGGSISAHALSGNIDTGSDAQGYHFISNVGSLSAAYNLSDGLGGISTEAGGDVNLTAGGDVTSVLPGKGVYYDDGNEVTPNNNDYYTAGSGAYGSQSGNVTIVAGGNVTGNYLVANGTGSIFAGVEMDANGNPVKDSSGNYVLGASGSAGTDLNNNGLALTLINGGWNVTAAQNILLQEVRNPNGDFDNAGGSAYDHYFNYAPGDYVNLSAGNYVQLGASVPLPRLSGTANNVPVIYPPILNITAGDGGVILGTGTSPNSLILFPSPQGSLTIDTTGSLTSDLNASGSSPQLFNLIVSDAGHSQYTTTANFGMSDNAASPVHLDSPTPISLDIGGNMNLVFLSSPEAAQINVGGNMDNCGFQGMNLSSDPSFQVQVLEADGSTRTFTVSPGATSINVTGDIINRSAFTSVTINSTEAPDMAYLSEAVNNAIGSTSISAATLTTSLYYNPTTQTLTYQNIPGVTLLSVLKLLNNLTVQIYKNGVPQWDDPPYDTIPATTTVSILGNPTPPSGTVTAASALLAQYNALGALPVDNASGSFIGYTIGGGGQFNITARTIDLGTSAGIQSEGATLPLAGLFGDGGVFDHGADINITTTGNNSTGENASGDLIGDLDMYSSSIASLFGGDITINAGGNVNAGSSVFSVTALGTRGIYSTSGGDVTVIASGNVNVNGSRIATYDGGNITVESLNGDVNAGTGASTPVSVSGYYEDPSTHIVYEDSPQIPFSGIVALTFPADASYPAPNATLGNILIEAPNGNVNANAAGILQVPENDVDYPDAVTTVLAGYELRDSMGNPVTASDMEDGSPVWVSANRNINAIGSGIIASNVKLDATGDINGLIIARNNIDINAQQNINVTALGGGNVSVNSGSGTISGEIIGVGSVSVSGGSIDASLVSANVSGATSGQSGLAQGTAANATSQSASSDDSNKPVADSGDTDDKKKGKQIALAQKVSRVTVLLPPKNLSENKTSKSPL
jgi:filamentous hemagglutinin family protein